MFVRSKSIIKLFLTSSKSSFNNIVFSSEKLILSESGEKYAQIKHCLQEKRVQNSSKQICWWNLMWEDGLFLLEEVLLWPVILDLFRLLIRLFMNYQSFELSFWRHPFTAEGSLLSKWCNAKFLQISSSEETNPSTTWTAWRWVNLH